MVEDEEDLHGLQTNFTNSSLTFQDTQYATPKLWECSRLKYEKDLTILV